MTVTVKSIKPLTIEADGRECKAAFDRAEFDKVPHVELGDKVNGDFMKDQNGFAIFAISNTA